MKPERWRQIEKVFYEALEFDPAVRPGFLKEACGADAELLREVESLLASYGQDDSFMAAPAVEYVARVLTVDQASSLVEQRLSHYKILSQLGEGGMGEVYLAEDSVLNRRVALKFLPREHMQNKERLRRFKQEAKTISVLNHPNILTIHEVGEANGHHFIATEFVDGETLRQRLHRAGRVKLSEALEVAIQVASALSAAHEAGITHRDIKPENIMLRRDGYVKVLDFGLAKLTEQDPPEIDPEAPTETIVKTEPGLVMGTVQYMSPEQARGLPVDARTDIWSLGVVLYEMVAGRPPFGGGTLTDTLVAIAEKEPAPLVRHAPEVPAELEWIIRSALRKGREERYQTVKELLTNLRRLKQRLEFEAELESATPLELSGAASVVTSSGQTRAEKATGPAAHHRTTAESLVGEIKQHKKGALALATLLIAAVGMAYLYSSRSINAPADSGGKAAIDSMAVLPFVNVSGDPDIEYLSDGIAESLINSLSQVPKLKVIAHNSVFRYIGRETDPQAVGRELGVQAVLMGRVIQRGDNLSVSAELVDARDNSHIWGEQYKRTVGEVIAMQEDISREISEKLQLRLSGEQQQRLTRRYTRNTEAYQLYLQGRYHLNKDSLEEVKKAVQYFDQAIAMDPDYALAYVGLADSYIELAQPWIAGLPPQEALREAKAAATKAVGIDSTLGEAHSSVAHVIELYDWDWLGAEREYRRAIELNPNYAIAHLWYAEYLSMMGRDDEAIAEGKRAIELDPLNNSVNGALGYYFYFARRYDQAIEQFHKTGDHWGLGWAYQEKRMYEEAITELQTALNVTGRHDFSVASLGYTYGVLGKRGEARKLLNELMERAERRYVSPYSIAHIYIGLGERDQAFEWLRKGSESHDEWMGWLKVDPKLDSLRSDPRFADLARRVGL